MHLRAFLNNTPTISGKLTQPNDNNTIKTLKNKNKITHFTGSNHSKLPNNVNPLKQC